MYVYTYVYMCIHNIYIYIYIYIYTNIHAYACIHIYTYACIDLYIYIADRDARGHRGRLIAAQVPKRANLLRRDPWLISQVAGFWRPPVQTKVINTSDLLPLWELLHIAIAGPETHGDTEAASLLLRFISHKVFIH
jgi:hypothetical protein